MGRVLEAIFRRPYRLLAMLVLIPLASLAVAYVVVPRTYQAQASLWALHRYAVIGATGLETNLQASPADTQSAALTELLQTRSFALEVARAANLAPTLNLSNDVLSNPARLEDALYTEISHNVTPTAQGYNLYVISYANRDPQVAQQVIKQIVNDFASQSTQFTLAEGQQLLASYQTQLATAQNTAAQDAAAESHYLAANPGLSAQRLANDPQYQALHAQTLQAQSNVQSIQSEISSIQQQISTQGSGSASLFNVIDSPHVLTQPVSRTKTYLYVGGISLAVALLGCILYLLILLRRDRSIYIPPDLQKVTTLPVLMQLPHLSPAVVPRVVEAGALSGSRLSTDEGRENSKYIDY